MVWWGGVRCSVVWWDGVGWVAVWCGVVWAPNDNERRTNEKRDEAKLKMEKNAINEITHLRIHAEALAAGLDSLRAEVALGVDVDDLALVCVWVYACTRPRTCWSYV